MERAGDPSGEDHCANHGHGQQECGQLHRKDVVGEEGFAESAGVPAGVAERRSGRRLPGRSVDRYQQHSEKQADHRCADHRGEGTLAGYRFNAQVFRPVDTEQHDHEQEQDDDGPRVDDHLHGGQERGVLEHEQHRHPEEGPDEEQGSVDRVAGQHDTDGPALDDRRSDDEDRGVHQLSRAGRSTGPV